MIWPWYGPSMTHRPPQATAPPGPPPADWLIDADLLRALLHGQHPDLAGLPLALADSGWDNQMWRLGPDLALRLPRRAASAPLISHEQTWLPMLAPRLPLPVPAPLRVGRPSALFPAPWSVLPWLRGQPADLAPPPEDAAAAALVAFLAALHQPAPAAAPVNPFRGVALAARAAVCEQRMASLVEWSNLVTPAVRQAWDAALAAALDGPPTWIHGDLHPLNLLVHGGALSAVIDWGDMAQGDPATDLAAIWMLLDSPAARSAAMQSYPAPSPATWARARGWAVMFGVFLAHSGQTGATRVSAVGARTLARLDADG